MQYLPMQPCLRIWWTSRICGRSWRCCMANLNETTPRQMQSSDRRSAERSPMVTQCSLSASAVSSAGTSVRAPQQATSSSQAPRNPMREFLSIDIEASESEFTSVQCLAHETCGETVRVRKFHPRRGIGQASYRPLLQGNSLRNSRGWVIFFTSSMVFYLSEKERKQMNYLLNY